MKINWRLLLGIGVSVVALALILKDVSWPALVGAVTQGDYRWLIPATVVMMIAMWLRALRWQSLLDNRIAAMRSFHIENAGNLLNNVLPLRLGEVARAYLVSRKSDVTAMQSLSTIFIERILDVLTMFALLLVVLPFVPAPAVFVQGGQTAAFLAVSAVIALFIAAAFRTQAVGLAKRLLSWLPTTLGETLIARGDDFLRGVSAAGGKRLLAAIGWSIPIWLCCGTGAFLMLLVFVPAAEVKMGFFVTCVQALGLSIPSAPLGAGIYEAVTIAGLAVFNIDHDTALAYGLLVHLYTFLIVALLGIWGLDREGESLGHIASAAQTVMASNPPPPTDH